MKRLISLLILGMLANGCALMMEGGNGIYKEYVSPKLTRDKYAVVKMPTGYEIHIVDDNPTKFTWMLKLLPGKHRLKVSYHSRIASLNQRFSGSAAWLEFTAEGGRTYYIGHETYGPVEAKEDLYRTTKKLRWKPTIKDVTGTSLHEK